jgi:hypothetical protein
MTPRPFPFAAPRHANPVLFAIVAVALAGGTLGAPLVARAGPPDLDGEWKPMILTLSTAVFSALFAWTATRARTVAGATILCVTTAFAFGAANAACSFGLLVASEASSADAYSWIRAAIMAFSSALPFAIVFAAPFSLGLGVAYALPVRSAVAARARRSHDGFDHALGRIGLFALAAAACAFVLGVRNSPYPLPHVVVVCAALSLAFGAVLVIQSTRRRRARSQWVRAVRAGRCDGWRVAPLSAAVDVDALLPLGRTPPEACDGVIVCEPGRRSPDRAPGRAEPRALLVLGTGRTGSE